MTAGRKPAGLDIIDSVEGSVYAKNRVRVILETLSGKRSIDVACQELGIGRSRFHELRKQLVESMVEEFEPKPAGRPAPPKKDDEQLEQMREELLATRMALKAAEVREEIAWIKGTEPSGKKKQK